MEFFEGVNISQLKKHQRNFFTLALGGPNIYEGRDMRKAHEHLKIDDVHFDLVKQHMAEALKEIGAQEWQVQTAMDTVEPMRKDVLNK